MSSAREKGQDEREVARRVAAAEARTAAARARVVPSTARAGLAVSTGIARVTALPQAATRKEAKAKAVKGAKAKAEKASTR